MHSSFKPYARSIHPLCILHLCLLMHALFIPYACFIHSLCMLYSFLMHALFILYGCFIMVKLHRGAMCSSETCLSKQPVHGENMKQIESRGFTPPAQPLCRRPWHSLLLLSQFFLEELFRGNRDCPWHGTQCLLFFSGRNNKQFMSQRKEMAARVKALGAES
jgi:hypothetical protein